MTNHHHQGKAEQIYNKEHFVGPFRHRKNKYKTNVSIRSEKVHVKANMANIVLGPSNKDINK